MRAYGGQIGLPHQRALGVNHRQGIARRTQQARQRVAHRIIEAERVVSLGGRARLQRLQHV